MSTIGKKLLGLLNKPVKRSKKGEANIIPFEQAENLGVIFTWSDSKKESELAAFIKLLGEEKKVDVLCFNPTKTPINSNYPTVDISSLSNLGKLNSEVAQKFIGSSFDYIFHFDFELNEVVKSILVQSKAKCRVGLHSEDGSRYYELMIGINKSAGITNFAQQMAKYVKAIR